MQKSASYDIRMLERRTSQLMEWGNDLESGKLSFEMAIRKFDSKSKLIQESFERIINHESFLPLIPSSEVDALLVAFCLASARFYLHRHSPEKRQRLYESALESASRLGNQFGLSRLYSILGSAFSGQHLFHPAKECFEASLDISSNEIEPKQLIETLGNLGNVYGRLNDTQKAFQYQFQALSIATKECSQMRSKLLCSIGWSYRHKGNWEKAMDYFQKSANEATDVIDEGYALGSLGSTYRQTGDRENAEKCLLQRIILARQINDTEGERNSLGCLGSVYSDAGRYPEAWKCHNDALTLSRKRHDIGGEAIDINNLGDVLFKQGNIENAIAQYKRAIDLFHSAGNSLREGICLKNIAICYGDTHNYELAIPAGRKAIQVLRNSEKSSDRINEIEEMIQKWTKQLSIQEIEK